MLRHPLEDNYMCLAFAIVHRVSCNKAWLCVVGERVGADEEGTKEKKTRKKIGPEEKKQIIKLRKKGWSYKKIGDKFGYSDATICCICIKNAKEKGKHQPRLKEVLSFDEKVKIVEMRKTMTLNAIAKIYNTTTSIIYNIEKTTKEDILRRQSH